MSNEQSDEHSQELEKATQEQASAAALCPNCHAPLYGQWCYYCGQSQKPIDRFFFSLVAEAFEDVFSWDSRAGRTLGNLLVRPGFLTREYFAGRRARYLPPLRLYIIASVLFFFILSLQTIVDGGRTALVARDEGIAIEINGDGDDKEQVNTNGDKQATDPTQNAELEKTIQGLEQIEIGWLSEKSNRALQERLKTQAVKFTKILKEDPGEILDILLDVAPPVLFVLLPLFALLLKVVYITSGRYYTEHLILAVHNHTFLFTILIIDTPIIAYENSVPLLGYLQTVIQIWILVYMYLSLKFVYRQGYFVTFMKYIVLGTSYLILASLGLAIALVLGILTL